MGGNNLGYAAPIVAGAAVAVVHLAAGTVYSSARSFSISAIAAMAAGRNGIFAQRFNLLTESPCVHASNRIARGLFLFLWRLLDCAFANARRTVTLRASGRTANRARDGRYAMGRDLLRLE
jgi:hypothetical protein